MIFYFGVLFRDDDFEAVFGELAEERMITLRSDFGV